MATAIERSVGLQLPQERLGRALRQTQRLPCHAPAPVDSEHHGQRKLASRKRGNLLQFLILSDLEVLAFQAGDQAAFGVGHRGIHFDQLNPCRKLRNRLLRTASARGGESGHTGDTENGRARVVQSARKVSMGNLGIPELLIILSIIILIFGANRLPEIGRGIGRGIRNFKDATKDGTEGAEKS